MTTLGRLADAEQFADIILKTDADGRLVRLRDVAQIELGAQGYDQTCTLDGKPSVALSIYQLPGSNALETAELVADKMEELKDRFPQGVDYAIVYDTTPFINESINEVFKTLRDAVILVAVVVLLFLQNWRSAIIPLVAVPVAIIGTFAVMAAMGFSLNNLTLFGLVLAIGIVVDDAIVVVEAVEHHIEHGLSPREATDPGDGGGLRPGHRDRPGADGGVRALRVHPRHHRPVLPAVRADHRRLDGDLGVQLADAQPGPGRAAAQAATRRRPSEPLPRLVLRAGRRLARLQVPRSAGSSPSHRRIRSPTTRWAPLAAGAVDRAAWRGWVVGPCRSNRVLWRGSSALFNVGFECATDVYTRMVGDAAAGQRCSCCSVYGGLLYLTYYGFTHDAHRLHPVAGQGLSARQRAAARLDLGRAHPGGDAADRGDRQQDARRRAHGGHRRPVDPAQRQRAELRRRCT